MTIMTRTVEVILRTSGTTKKKIERKSVKFNKYNFKKKFLHSFTFESFGKDQVRDHKDHP